MIRNNPTLTIDVELYKDCLDNSGLSEAQKIELLETLWEVVCEFAMMGFHVHPVQQAQQSCAKEVSALLPFTQAVTPKLESQKTGLSQVFATACDQSKKTNIKKGDNNANFRPLQP